MAKAKKQSKTKKVLNWLDPKTPTKGILLFAIIFALVGGSYMAYRSFAALPNSRSGYLDWHLYGGGKYTPSFVSTDGLVCTTTTFDTYNSFYDAQYHWYIEVYESGQWRQVRQSQQYSANGNKDHSCADDKIYAGHTYRVKFDPTDIVFMHGSYWVWGYNHS